MLTFTIVLNFLLVFIKLINGYNICPPIELRSSLTPKQTKSDYLNPSIKTTITTTTSSLSSLTSSSVLYLPSSSTTTTSDGSNESSSSPKIVCDCTTETRESAPSWEILCYQEYTLNSPEPDYRSESTVDPETVQYSALPIAFIIKYVISRYIEINCYDSSPEFQPAMFQGFGVNEIDSFRVINCSLPTVPFNLIFHRTSIGSSKDSASSSSSTSKQQTQSSRGGGSTGNGSSQLDSGGTTSSNKVKSIRSLELRRATPIKVDVKQLKHLFHGLDRLEQLTLENHIISIPTSERLISNRGGGTVGGEGRRYGRRFKRSFGTRLNSSESSEFGSKLVANEKKVTINPIVGTSSFYSSSSADFDPSTGFTFSTTMKTTAPSLSKVITTKAPTTLSAAIAAQITTPSPTIIPETVAMTTKKPTSIQLSKIPDNNKYYTPKEVDEINLNSHIESPDKKIEEKPVDDSIRKSSSLSPLSSFSPTTVAGLLETKPSLPVASETDDLNADKSTLIPGITVNRQESQSSYQFLSNPVDFSFGSYFPMLKTLVLNNFLVTKSSDSSLILKNLLSNLNNLEQLDLRSNILTHIPENLFSGSGRKIKRLYLMRNSIESLHPFAFANLKELEVLDLFSNKIQLLPDSLLKDTNKLKQFRIKSNNFITLPLNLFASTPLLTSLDLSSNRELSLLPVDLLKGLHQLRDLTINDCNLNKFTINPAKFFFYAFNLEKIELKGNLLTNLTQFHLFAGNPKLSTLDVSNNRIKEIDADIFNENSSSLVNLNLAKNDLSFIPDKFLYHLKNLRTLNIGNNNLHTINNNIFYTLSNLEVLDLSRNQLISVNPGESKIPFGLGAYLKKINLSHNNLTNFNREFNSIQWNLHLEIEEINLSANKLQGQVKIPIFYSTKSKIILDLRDNQIESVNMDAILINEKLFIEILDTNKAYADGADSSEVKVFISGNPFHCDCNLFPLLKYTRSSTLAKYENLVEKVSFDVSSDKLKCSSPASLSGKSFYEISTSDLTCPLLQTKVCPSSCDCWFRAHDERILIDCQSRNLSSIPKETVNIANYQSLNLSGIKSGTLIKAVTLKMQNNRIKNLQPLERLVSPTHLLSKDVPSTTTISTSASSVGRKKVSTSTILFELYFDNNTIDAIPSSLIKLLKLSTHSINDVNQENSVSESDKDKDGPDTSQSPSSGKPLKHQSSSVTILSASSSSPTKAAIVSLVSLRNNNIHTIPAEFIEDLRELQLAVADNQSISHTGSSNPDANTNNVGSSSIALPKFLKLYLGNNPYNCTPEETSASGEKLFCQMREFKSWLTGNYRIVGDIADINCDSLDYNSNSALINIPDTILCPQLAQLDQTVLLTMTAICISLALCLLLISILYYRNKQTVLAFFYIHLNPIFVCLHFHEDDLDEDKLYDAFVSYSSADRDIVMQLIEKLEEPSSISNTSICYLQSQSGLPSIHEGHYDQIVPDVGHDIKSLDKSYVSSNIFGNKGLNDSDRNRTSAANHLRATSGGLNGNSHFSDESTMEPDQTQYFKLCIHERDWLPGNLISWNIVNSVQNSRRTIIILSKDFIQSIWFQVEFHTAYYQMLEDKIDRLIVIVRGELPPKDQMDKDLVFLLTTKTYLVWGEKWFWEKLRYALPHKSTRKRALVSSLTDNSNSDNKSRCLKKSHFSTNAINYLKSNKDGSSKSKSPSKSAMMKEYVDQAIANHFQLNSTSNGSSLKSNVINGKSSFSLSSTTITTSTTASSTTPTSPSLQSNMPNYGSTSDPIDGNFSTIKTSNRVINNDKGDIGDYSKQGHVNESFVIETET